MGFYQNYLQGSYQEVYDKLVALQEQVYVEPYYTDALLVAREMMRRVRHNLELLVPRLHQLGYQFGKGFTEGLSPEERALVENDAPIFKAADSKTPEKIQMLEQLTGTLPLALTCWYEGVGSVNLVGLFPSTKDRNVDLDYGCVLDPLFMYSIEMAIRMVSEYLKKGVWHRSPTLALSPDNYYKYNCSGSGAYSLLLPCKAFDAPLLLERHQTTFIHYLRICFRWAGFPGLEVENRLTPSELAFLREGLQEF